MKHRDFSPSGRGCSTDIFFFDVDLVCISSAISMTGSKEVQFVELHSYIKILDDNTCSSDSFFRLYFFRGHTLDTTNLSVTRLFTYSNRRWIYSVLSLLTTTFGEEQVT